MSDVVVVPAARLLPILCWIQALITVENILLMLNVQRLPSSYRYCISNHNTEEVQHGKF